MSFYTKNDIIYKKLKDKIIDGELRPGERLVISDLANEFDLSPMPVREAIKRLQQDGFVEVIPHVGARVTPFNLREFTEIAAIRIELEAMAVKLAVLNIDDKGIEALEEILKESEICLKNNDNSEYARLNKEFHTRIYEHSTNRYLYELIMTLWAKSEFSRVIFTKLSDRNSTSHKEHKKILAAIKEKDSEKASNELKKQKEAAFKVLIDAFNKEKDE